MIITSKDILFQEASKPAPKHSFAYLDSKQSVGGRFEMYIAGYIKAAEILYEQYFVEDNSTFVFDSIVFPLCFTYRHVTELYIKKLYFCCSGTTKEDKEKFLKKSSHDIEGAWEKTKPHILKLVDKLGIERDQIDLEAIESYLSQIAKFDEGSFTMRFPVGKNAKGITYTNLRLDIEHLHNRMTALFEYLRILESRISDTIINNQVSIEFSDRVFIEYDKARNNISDVISILRSNDESALRHKIDKMNIGAVTLTTLLLCAGRDLYGKEYQLAKNCEERGKDYLWILKATYDECFFISFEDTDLSKWEICFKLFEMRSDLAADWLDESIKEMESAISNWRKQSNG